MSSVLIDPFASGSAAVRRSGCVCSLGTLPGRTDGRTDGQRGADGGLIGCTFIPSLTPDYNFIILILFF